MTSLCFGSQCGAEADRMSEYEVTVYYIMWWCVSFAGHKQGQIKACDLQRVVCV
jgi:hypothetical protein